MLRRIRDDISAKSYARKAKEEVHESPRLLREIKSAVAKENRAAADAITSVIESRGAAVIKLESRAAMAELYRAKGAVLQALRAYGIEQLRFRV